MSTNASTANKSPERRQDAIFAGGCFWCLQPPFDALSGVLKTSVGYIGGEKSQATYDAVSQGGTGHYEALRVTYDPTRISYDGLLAVFWENIDPLDDSGQFCDKGEQYKSAIFYGSETEKSVATKSLQKISGLFKEDIKTLILPKTPFFKAEDYHQNYYKKNPIRYKFYRYNCGRDQRLKKLWGDRKPIQN